MNAFNRELMVFDSIENAYNFVARASEGESKQDVQSDFQREEHSLDEPPRVSGLRLVLNILRMSTRGAPQNPVITITNDDALPFPWSRQRAFSSKLNIHPTNAEATGVPVPWYVRTSPAFSQSHRRAERKSVPSPG